MDKIILKRPLKKALIVLQSIPRRYYVLGAFLLFATLLIAIFWPRHVMFSYAAKTCFYQPTIAPDFLRSKSDSYRLEASGKWVVGGVTLAAHTMCVIPLKAPQRGEKSVSLSLFGVPLLQKIYTIAAIEPPVVSLRTLKDVVPLSRPLAVNLSGNDGVFSYKANFDAQKTANCTVAQQKIVCDINKLQLKQGTSYTLSIERYYRNQKIATVATKPITTLPAVTIKNTSIASGQIVYDKPKNIVLSTDKPVVSATATLKRADTNQTIPIKISSKEQSITLTWDVELPRQLSYQLVVDTIIAADGSGIDGSYTVPFTTSGGPKVKSISVGSYKVPLGATAVLTFDQPLLDTQDVSSAITLSGGATIVSRQGARVLVSFASVARCSDVVIAVGDNLLSNYNIAGGSTWRYNTRTICQSVSSIGSSAKGRQITAYTFGAGPKVVVYTGAIHGSEASTRALMLQWVDELEAKSRSIPSDKTVIVIPLINPDGFASGTRTNANNVDLNRNFATADWKKDITTVTNAPFPGGGGASAMSEPETKAIGSYISRMRPQLVLSYHSIGGIVAANQRGDSSARASQYARLSGYGNATGSSTTFEYAVSGTADDYYGEVLGVPSVLVELGSHSSPQFERNRDAMWAMLW